MSLAYLLRAPVARGCGSRKAGGIYACCGLSSDGLPIEHFLIDPVRALAVSCFRAPILLEDPDCSEVKHLAIWVGAEFYPSPWDFVEETRRLGASRRIPGEFDFSQLTPGLSRMVLVHPRAAIARIDPPDACPKDAIETAGHGTVVPCLGALRHYVAALGSNRAESLDVGGRLAIAVGALSYFVPARQVDGVASSELSPAAFMQLPITHFEYQAKDCDDSGPPEFAERCERSGFQGVVVDEPSALEPADSAETIEKGEDRIFD